MIPDPHWTIRYWQWILSKPKNENPLVTGSVHKDVYVTLPCTGGGEDCSRSLNLTIEDSRKDILIPVYCAECCEAEICDVEPTDEKMMELVRKDISCVLDLECSVDGVQLEPDYLENAPFEVRVPTNNILDGDPPKGTYRAVACWLLAKSWPINFW